MMPRIVEVRQNILRENDLLARNMRRRFEDAGTLVVNLVSAPGAGRTALLQRTLKELGSTKRVAALVGDLATDRGACRLRESGARVHQITTGTVCHLDARMVESALEEWDLSEIDTLFVENVGNLVCRASYDLGEHLRVVLMSVTQGEDKPLKYPTLFNTADLVLITKADLVDAVAFERDDALANVQSVRPGLETMELSAKTGAGMEPWLERLGALSHAPASG